MKLLDITRPSATALLGFARSAGGCVAAGSILIGSATTAAAASKLGELAPFSAISIDAPALGKWDATGGATTPLKDHEIARDGASGQSATDLPAFSGASR